METVRNPPQHSQDDFKSQIPENSIFMSNQSKKMSEIENDRDLDTFKRFDFNSAPPKKTAMTHAMGDDFDKKQNSTNSNSPISVTSLDEIFESGESKNGNMHQKTSFYSSSGASSLFSSGM